jgi:hypothetical protein
LIYSDYIIAKTVESIALIVLALRDHIISNLTSKILILLVLSNFVNTDFINKHAPNVK